MSPYANEPFTVAGWLSHARPLVDEIAGRGRIPLVVGGTGLYVSALVDGYDFASQPWSPELRERLAAELETEGLAPLADRLARIDPKAAERTDLRNPRRVLRALERAEPAGRSHAPRSTPYPGRLALVGISGSGMRLTGLEVLGPAGGRGLLEYLGGYVGDAPT